MNFQGTKEIGEFEFVLRDKLICLIDTPGFNDTERTDREVLDDIATWMGVSYSQDIKLAGIIYLHSATDTRMTGTALNNLKMFKKLCGEDFFPRVALTTTKWDLLDKRTAEKREAELLEQDDFWKKMYQGGCSIERHWGDRDSAMEILMAVIRNHRKQRNPGRLQVQREMVDEKRSLDDTAAGKEVNAKIEEERIKFQKELNRLKEDMQDAIAEGELRHAEMLRKQEEKLRNKLNQGYEDQKKMNIKLDEMQKQHIEQLEEMQSKLKESQAALEAARAELSRQREELNSVGLNSHRALTLKRNIAEGEAHLSEASEDVAMQEQVVQAKKRSEFLPGCPWR
jgi:hypothetical protein